LPTHCHKIFLEETGCDSGLDLTGSAEGTEIGSFETATKLHILEMGGAHSDNYEPY
jgi:hypothetical protein